MTIDRTTRLFIATAFSCLALSLALPKTSRLRADPPAPDGTNEGLSKLLQDRVTTLQKAATSAYKRYQQGTEDFANVDRLNYLLLDAQQQAGGSPAGQIARLQNSLVDAKKEQAGVDKAVAAGLDPTEAGLEAKAYCLDIEIKLAELQK